MVPEEVARRILAYWESLAVSQQEVPQPTGLGYRGSTLRAPDGRMWFVYREVVALLADGPPEVRSDKDREFERRLLDSAPPDLLPPGSLSV